MAGSTTPPSADPAGPPRRQTVAVAYSGGRDSTALLHATARAAAESGGLEVLALHVHHGLSPHADLWLTHAQAQCQAWAEQGWPVSLRVTHLHLAVGCGDSVEAVARRARYRALSAMAQEAGCDIVLLGHHLQDQAETFLLQALRASGVAGLAAMPAAVVRDGITWARPWLHRDRADIEAYVAHHGLAYVDDDSNSQARFARNRLRLGVWPTMEAAFPQAQRALAAAASHQADVLACLGVWLDENLPLIVDDREGAGALLVQRWMAWSEGPRRQLLRAWFHRASGLALPAAWTARLQRELSMPGEGRALQWPLTLTGDEGGVRRGVLSLYRGRLSWQPSRPAAAGAASAPLATGFQQAVSIVAPGPLHLPEGWGTLWVERTDHGGVPLAWLAHAELRERVGGEQFQAGPGRPARSLKKQFQQAGVPAWARRGPLLWARGQLVYVPGLGVDARARACPGEPQVTFRWQEDAAQGSAAAVSGPDGG